MRVVYSRGELIKSQELALAEARSLAKALENLSVTIRARVGSEGKLFGSVGTLDIATAVTEAGVAVEKKQIRLTRSRGEHPIVLLEGPFSPGFTPRSGT